MVYEASSNYLLLVVFGMRISSTESVRRGNGFLCLHCTIYASGLNLIQSGGQLRPSAVRCISLVMCTRRSSFSWEN